MLRVRRARLVGTILFLIREIGITVMRFFVMERPGGKVIAAAWPGKLKTVFQCVGLSMLLLPFWSLGNGQATPFWMTAYYFLTYAIIYVHWSCASTRVPCTCTTRSSPRSGSDGYSNAGIVRQSRGRHPQDLRGEQYENRLR